MSVFGNPHAKVSLRKQTLNHSLVPTELDLADGTKAVAFPITAADHIPLTLLAHMCDEFNDEIKTGQTYPIDEPLNVEEFRNYWLGDFTGIVLQGTLEDFEKLAESSAPQVSEAAASSKGDPSRLYENYHQKGDPPVTEAARLIPKSADWSKVFLGSFHVLPNYPGRSSHVCNSGFLVSPALRSSDKKIGTAMGKIYLQWAPKLGYTYAIFNLVYATNKSIKIWENLGFEQIGKVPGAGILEGSDQPVDAFIFGKKLI